VRSTTVIQASGSGEAGDRHLLRLFYTVQECLRLALSSVIGHGLRSLLTMLGIVVGVVSVICVVALVEGMSHSITRQFEGLGSGTLTLRSYTPLQDQLRGKFNRLRVADLDELRFRIDGIANVTPIVFGGQRFGAEARNGASTAYGQIYGTTTSFQDVRHIFPRSGRFLTGSDETTRRRVVVLGEQMRKDLKLPEQPDGHFIQIGEEWFKVIGVMEARGEIFGQNQDAYLLMPYNTALAVTGVITQPDLWITFTVLDLGSVDDVKRRVTVLVRKLHNLKPGQPDDFVVEAADALATTFKQISTSVALVLAGIVGISSVVGGVGIMNIMLVSVTERTREIGLAKALGAPRSFILMQFLLEALLLALGGGLLGIAGGYGLAYAAAATIPSLPPPQIPLWVVLGSALFSACIGIVFGILPASKAANLQPIEALRYE
jgi:putative ABC transport system permease protein